MEQVLKGFAATVLLLLAGDVLAHDFWIEPATFQPAEGTDLGVGLRVGEAFKGVAYPRNPGHIRRFVLAEPGGEKDVPGRAGGDPAGQVRIGESGSLVLGYRSTRTVFQMGAEAFEAYLREEGLDQVAEYRARRRETGRPVREAFSRCAKAVIQAGDAPGAGHDRALGFALELVPERNPYTLRLGDVLPVRILYQGQPLEGARIAAINAERPTEVGLRRDPTRRGGYACGWIGAAAGWLKASTWCPRPGMWLRIGRVSGRR